MTIKINLGLDNSPFNSEEDILLLFSNNFIIHQDTVEFKIVEATYVIDGEEILEDTAVFKIHTKHQVDLEDVHYHMQLACSVFDQDAIAYRDTWTGEGYVAHNVRYTGEKYVFDPAFFKN